MKHPEKRLLSRIQVGEIPRGSLSVSLHGQHIAIERLRDISNSGISFSLGKSIAVSERIAIAYVDPKVKLEVFGRVAWCSQTHGNPEHPSAEPHYLMGVELLSPMMLLAVLPKA